MGWHNLPFLSKVLKGILVNGEALALMGPSILNPRNPLFRVPAIRNKIYYRLKPYIPERLRKALRSRFALRLQKRVGNMWPIMPYSERPPEGWPGWPEGKKFALVLTHDVEDRRGLENCRSLMELEIDLGFRSSFNFVPEGDYIVPIDLRRDLRQNGFEVAIHDLKHDGHLFDSRREFRMKAERINQYVKAWEAVGFRAGFMLHNLEWLHDLDVQYDASTFDTDPFEPQPDGNQTIFPFWVSHPLSPGALASASENSHGGYVELPYTLPQDSTLFLLLKHKTIRIWQEKMDWIAEHGGMALVIVHPDYVSFANKSGVSTYPAALYKEFLVWAKNKYADAYWHAVPAEVAEFIRPLQCQRAQSHPGLSRPSASLPLG